MSQKSRVSILCSGLCSGFRSAVRLVTPAALFLVLGALAVAEETAPGESQINTYDWVPAGAPSHRKAGETSSPSHVYFCGIADPF